MALLLLPKSMRVVRGRLVTLASGAAAGKFLRYEAVAPTVAAQTAYGIECEVTRPTRGAAVPCTLSQEPAQGRNRALTWRLLCWRWTPSLQPQQEGWSYYSCLSCSVENIAQWPAVALKHGRSLHAGKASPLCCLLSGLMQVSLSCRWRATVRCTTAAPCSSWTSGGTTPACGRARRPGASRTPAAHHSALCFVAHPWHTAAGGLRDHGLASSCTPGQVQRCACRPGTRSGLLQAGQRPARRPGGLRRGPGPCDVDCLVLLGGQRRARCACCKAPRRSASAPLCRDGVRGGAGCVRASTPRAARVCGARAARRPHSCTRCQSAGGACSWRRRAWSPSRRCRSRRSSDACTAAWPPWASRRAPARPAAAPPRLPCAPVPALLEEQP